MNEATRSPNSTASFSPCSLNTAACCSCGVASRISFGSVASDICSIRGKSLPRAASMTPGSNSTSCPETTANRISKTASVSGDRAKRVGCRLMVCTSVTQLFRCREERFAAGVCPEARQTWLRIARRLADRTSCSFDPFGPRATGGPCRSFLDPAVDARQR